MNYLLLEFTDVEGDVFHLTTESYISIFVWKMLRAQYEVKVKLSKSLEEKKVSVSVNFNEIQREITATEDGRKLPMLQVDECLNVVGLCSVLRGLCRLMKLTPSGELATQLLGFKENCLMSPSEVSLWTHFCEREMVACADRLRTATTEMEFPIEMVKFERDLANPVRVHNVYKYARDTRKDQSIKSGSELNLEHKYCHGNEVNLSDVILYSIYKLIFSSTVDVDDVKEMIPLTINWFGNLESEKFDEIYSSLRSGLKDDMKPNVMFTGEVPKVNEDGKYFSLLKRELTGYKHKNRKLFTDQTEIDVVLAKLKSLKIDIKSEPGEPHDSVNDDYVSELLICGELPTNRFEKKKSQLKSFANEVIKIAQPGDIIVDFCSGTGHLGFLIAKLLPRCRVIILENKEESINRAKVKATKLQLDNVTFYQCNLEYFHEKFTIGLSLHACGVATDLVLRKCWANGANFICSPCCYGKIQDLGCLPQSQIYRSVLSAKDLINISHCSDQTHSESNVKHINIEKSQQGYFCMDVIDTDRLLRAQELGYLTQLKRLFPEDCTLKNRLLVGVYPNSSKRKQLLYVENE